jgi:hypothetical protein
MFKIKIKDLKLFSNYSKSKKRKPARTSFNITDNTNMF